MTFVVLESQKASRYLVAYRVSSNLRSNKLKHPWETSLNKAFKAFKAFKADS